MATFVQSKSLAVGAATATTIAVTLDTIIGVGDLVAVAVAWGTSDVTPTCADSLLTNYTIREKNWDAVAGGVAMFYGVATAAGGNSVTVTFGVSSVAFRLLSVHVYRNAGAFVASNYRLQNNPGNGANAIATNSFIVTREGSLVFAFSRYPSTNTTFTAGTNYVGRESGNADTSAADFMTEDRLLAPSGSQVATWSNTSGVGLIQNSVMVFLSAPNGSTVIRRRRR